MLVVAEERRFQFLVALRLGADEEPTGLERSDNVQVGQVGHAAGRAASAVRVAEHAEAMRGILAAQHSAISSLAGVTNAKRLEHELGGQEAHLVVAVVRVALHVDYVVFVFLHDLLHVGRSVVRAAVVVALKAVIDDVALDVVRAKRDVATMANGTHGLRCPNAGAADERLLEVHVALVRIALLALHLRLALQRALVVEPSGEVTTANDGVTVDFVGYAVGFGRFALYQRDLSHGAVLGAIEAHERGGGGEEKREEGK